MDLDDTMFQTLRKCDREENLFTAVYTKDGKPLSFMTPKQQAFFSMLNAQMVIIPTTARNYSAFNRVQLKFNHCVILNFGGIVLDPEKQVDQEWFERSRQESHKVKEKLLYVFDQVQKFMMHEHLNSTVRIIEDFGLPFYIVIKNLQKKTEELDHIYRSVLLKYNEGDTYIHYNDNNLCLLPTYLNKANAVLHIIHKYISSNNQEFMTIGMGDSISDLDFMSVCDYMLCPTTSQIQKKIHSHATI